MSTEQTELVLRIPLPTWFPVGVSQEGILHQIWKKEVKQHILCRPVAAGTLPCRFKSPLVWDGSAPDLSFPQAPATLYCFSESWRKCVSAQLKAPPFPTSYPLRYQDREVMRKTLVPVYPDWFHQLLMLKSQFFFSNHHLANPSEFRLNNCIQTQQTTRPGLKLSPLWEFPSP